MLNPHGNVNIQYDGQGSSRVYIAEAHAQNAGWYQCTAYNSAGSAETRARLQVAAAAVPVMSQLDSSHFKLKIMQTGRVIEKP